MHTPLAIALAAALLLAAPAASAGKAIVTPVLLPTVAGSLQCWAVNASETRTVHVEMEIREPLGAVDASGGATLLPGSATGLISTEDTSGYCFVRVTRGSAKNVRVSLVAVEAGAPLAAVEGR